MRAFKVPAKAEVVDIVKQKPGPIQLADRYKELKAFILRMDANDVTKVLNELVAVHNKAGGMKQTEIKGLITKIIMAAEPDKRSTIIAKLNAKESFKNKIRNLVGAKTKLYLGENDVPKIFTYLLDREVAKHPKMPLSVAVKDGIMNMFSYTVKKGGKDVRVPFLFSYTEQVELIDIWDKWGKIPEKKRATLIKFCETATRADLDKKFKAFFKNNKDLLAALEQLLDAGQPEEVGDFLKNKKVPEDLIEQGKAYATLRSHVQAYKDEMKVGVKALKPTLVGRSKDVWEKKKTTSKVLKVLHPGITFKWAKGAQTKKGKVAKYAVAISVLLAEIYAIGKGVEYVGEKIFSKKEEKEIEKVAKAIQAYWKEVCAIDLNTETARVLATTLLMSAYGPSGGKLKDKMVDVGKYTFALSDPQGMEFMEKFVLKGKKGYFFTADETKMNELGKESNPEKLTRKDLIKKGYIVGSDKLFIQTFCNQFGGMGKEWISYFMNHKKEFISLYEGVVQGTIPRCYVSAYLKSKEPDITEPSTLLMPLKHLKSKKPTDIKGDVSEYLRKKFGGVVVPYSLLDLADKYAANKKMSLAIFDEVASVGGIFNKPEIISKNELIYSSDPSRLYGDIYTNLQTKINPSEIYKRCKELGLDVSVLPDPKKTSPKEFLAAVMTIYPDYELEFIGPRADVASIMASAKDPKTTMPYFIGPVEIAQWDKRFLKDADAARFVMRYTGKKNAGLFNWLAKTKMKGINVYSLTKYLMKHEGEVENLVWRVKEKGKGMSDFESVLGSWFLKNPERMKFFEQPLTKEEKKFVKLFTKKGKGLGPWLERNMMDADAKAIIWHLKWYVGVKKKKVPVVKKKVPLLKGKAVTKKKMMLAGKELDLVKEFNDDPKKFEKILDDLVAAKPGKFKRTGGIADFTPLEYFPRKIMLEKPMETVARETKKELESIADFRKDYEVFFDIVDSQLESLGYKGNKELKDKVHIELLALMIKTVDGEKKAKTKLTTQYGIAYSKKEGTFKIAGLDKFKTFVDGLAGG